MYRPSKFLSIAILSILIMLIITPISFGNSAEPPSIVMLATNAPDDLEISIFSNGEYVKSQRLNKSIKNYYTFYSSKLGDIDDYKVKISTKDNTFELKLDEPLDRYNNIFTLDLEKQTLAYGKSLSRTFTLISLRIVLTIIIEGIIFLLFGYRQKRSWVIFLVTNLVTQGFLNIWLNTLNPIGSYIMFALIFGEICVFIAESIVFSKFVEEQDRGIAISYVLAANLSSLFLGGYLITIFPF